MRLKSKTGGHQREPPNIEKQYPSLIRGRSTLVVCMSHFAKIPA